MTQLAIRVTETLLYQVYATELGRDKRDVGPRFPTPSEAVRYADLIDQPYVSPRSDDALGGPLDSAVSRPRGAQSGPPSGPPDPGRHSASPVRSSAPSPAAFPPAAGDPQPATSEPPEALTAADNETLPLGL